MIKIPHNETTKHIAFCITTPSCLYEQIWHSYIKQMAFPAIQNKPHVCTQKQQH